MFIALCLIFCDFTPPPSPSSLLLVSIFYADAGQVLLISIAGAALVINAEMVQ